jgi:chromosome segregation ATPase
MKQAIHYTDLHFEHEVWAKELAFLKDEVAFFERRLGELVTKNTDKDMLAQLEQFQNRFIRQKEVIDELNHDINIHEDRLQQFIEEHPVAIDRVRFNDQATLRDKMDTNRKLYADLKAEYFKFMAKWM